MTKQNIIDIVSDATGLTKVETEAVITGVSLAPVIFTVKSLEAVGLVPSRSLILSGTVSSCVFPIPKS